MAQKIGVQIIVSHEPPYCSKWNPIEHRLFSQVHRSLQGVGFTDYLLIKELMEKTSTQKGLRVIARINRKEYQIGLRASIEDIDQKRILKPPQNPEFIYTMLS